MNQINVLGTIYSIEYRNAEDDPILKDDSDGYCDKTSHKIIIANQRDDCDLDDFSQLQKCTLRHEIIHAFLNESGIQANFVNQKYGVSETMVDWFAIQAPKIYNVFSELDIL